MKLASTREGPCADEGFLSAQVNCSISLPVHKDKNNHGETWLIGLWDYKGGRLWIESPCGQLHRQSSPRSARVTQQSFCRRARKMVQIRPTLLSRSRTREGRSTSLYCLTCAKSVEEDTSSCALRTPGLRVFSSTICWRNDA